MSLELHDAHNHLQDERFGASTAELMETARREGVVRMVVNGSSESDWPAVRNLATAYPEVIPAFGYHPWYIGERSPEWRDRLVAYLENTPGAVIGEIGLDRWKPGLSYAGQEEIFMTQLRLGAQRKLPVSIHCLRAWGRLYDLLRAGPRPDRGFLLHSYGGPRDLIEPLARLGAYFSLPGYFAHERKARQREAFRHVPADRLLIETDAPDQLLPEDLNAHPVVDPGTGRPINHPANLGAVYRFAAELYGEPLEKLAARVRANFQRLFGS